MKVRRFMMAAAIFLALGASATTAQTIMMEKVVVAPGGGFASNGTTQLDATIAQPVAGMATNGTTTGSFGFWEPTPAVSGVALSGGTGGVTSIGSAPNPIRTDGEITIALARRGEVAVTLHDLTGHLLATLYSSTAEAGALRLSIDASTLASGTYYVAVSTPDALMQKPITVIR